MNTYHLHLFNNHWALSEKGDNTPLKLYRDMPQEEACQLACAYLKGSDSRLKIHDQSGTPTETKTFSPEDRKPVKR